MRKKLLCAIMLLLILAITGCSLMPTNESMGVSTDWTDFIKWDDKLFERVMEVVPSDLIGEKLGTVKETAPTNIVNYEPKNGTAGHLSKGTEFYSIHGYSQDSYIAALINGIYHLYKTNDSDSISFSFTLDDFEKVVGVSIDEIHETFGEPDGTLSGLWGEIYILRNGTTVIVYYTNGFVEYIKSGNISKEPFGNNSLFDNVITRIELQSGNNGNLAEITDADTIATLIGYFASTEFSKKEYGGNSTGWSYRMKFYDANNNLITDVFIMKSGRIKFNEYFYDTVLENAIDIDFIESLLP